jgi:hypothetical protein
MNITFQNYLCSNRYELLNQINIHNFQSTFVFESRINVFGELVIVNNVGTVARNDFIPIQYVYNPEVKKYDSMRKRVSNDFS